MSAVDRNDKNLAARRAVTPKEAMAMLSISKAHLFNMIRINRIHAVKIGDSRRIPVEEINRILREGC